MRSIIIALVAAGLLSSPAAAQSFLGEWRATAEAGDVPIAETLLVRKTADGFAITATPITQLPPGQPAAGPGTDIELIGDKFSYKRLVRTPQADLEIVYSGVVAGDTFAGTAEVGGFAVPYNGVRTGAAE